MSLTANERAEMCDSFEEFGPDAPTLCEGWNTRDLLAHLLVRERRPDAAASIVVPYLRKHAEQVTESYKAEPWDKMIKTFPAGVGTARRQPGSRRCIVEAAENYGSPVVPQVTRRGDVAQRRTRRHRR